MNLQSGHPLEKLQVNRRLDEFSEAPLIVEELFLRVAIRRISRAWTP